MANQKGRKKTGNTTSRKRQTRKRIEKDEGLAPYMDEITIVVTLVVCILLVLSNFDMCGTMGTYLSSFLFGLFGVMNYLLPFGGFIGMAFYISNRGNRKAKRKFISIICLIIVLTALLQMATGQNEMGMKIGDYYQASSASRLGGGVIGGILSKNLIHLFGTIGAVVILLGIGVLLFMFITEKLIFAYLGKQSAYRMQMRKEERERRRQEYEEMERRQPAAQPKRKAKTFTISKEEPKEETTDIISAKNADKQKLKKGKKEKRKDPAAMEEILPEGLEHMSIQRSQTVPDTGSIPVYEEELRKKFNPVHAKMESVDEQVVQEVINEFEKEEIPEIHVERAEAAPIGKNLDGVESEAQEIPAVMTESLESSPDRNPVYMDTQSNAEQNTVWAQKEETKNRIDSVSETPEMSDTMRMAAGDAGGVDKMGEKAAVPQADTSKVTDKIQEAAIDKIAEEKQEPKPEPKPYQFPPVQLLQAPKHDGNETSDDELKETAYKLHKTLESFGVKVNITNVSCGPTVTRYELHPEQGVKVSKITNLADDIKLNLAAADIRIEAPIPGKAAVGIEVPNKENSAVMFRELIESPEFKKHSSKICFAVGKDIGGKTVVSDIGKMPHLLIAGATGSGKSVCINTLIMSIIYKARPDEVKLIMVDPKVVELSVYNGIPHLLIPVVTDPKKASAALNWAVAEMTERYNKFAELGVRDLKGYNEKVKSVEYLEDERFQKMPSIVIIVDELADLMMVAPGEVEESICRLAQLARAAGIHLIIATQRPSVNVITGVIKANIPSRIAFSVSSAVDSRTIIDGAGAEKLLGKGDMLFYPTGYPKPIRVQGAFVSDQEVSAVVDFLTQDVKTSYDNSVVEKITTASKPGAGTAGPSNDRDEYFIEAAKFIIEKDKASIGMLQRVFKIGFNRASRIMDQLYEAGVVGEDEGTKPRKVVMSEEQFEQFVDDYV